MDIWSKIRADYIAGGISHRELSKKYGVGLTQIAKHSREEGWVKLREQKRLKYDAKVVDLVASREAKQANELCRVAEKLLRKVDMLGDLITTPRDLRDLTAAVKDIREILSIKGARDIREQEARIDKLLHDAKEKEQTAPEIRVTMVGADVSEYGK